jgi:amino acid permease
LVIPIAESMAEPERFPRVLSRVMIGVMILFTGAGTLAYSAFGSNIQTVVLVNLNQEAKLVQTVQFLYSIAILLSTPLMLFPAVGQDSIVSYLCRKSTQIETHSAGWPRFGSWRTVYSAAAASFRRGSSGKRISFASQSLSVVP